MNSPDPMRHTTRSDLALDETAELTILDAEGNVAHAIPGVRVQTGYMPGESPEYVEGIRTFHGPPREHIVLPGDNAAALWLIDQPLESIRATLTRGSVRVNCQLDGYQVRRVDPCPSCNHSGSVLDTWWKPIDAVIGASVATVHGAAHTPTP